MNHCPQCSTSSKKVYHVGECPSVPQDRGLAFVRKRSVGSPAYKQGRFIGYVMDYGKD